MTARYFAERRETAHVLSRDGSPPTVEAGRYQGIGRTEYHATGSRHEYTARMDGADPALSALDRKLIGALAEPWAGPVPAAAMLTKLAERLRADAAGHGWSAFVVSLRSFDQRVAAGAAGTLTEDHRRFCTINLEATGSGGVSARVDSAVGEPADLPAVAGQLLADLPRELSRLAGLPERGLPEQTRPVILGAGQAAMFFHEICGHPLEADVVASGTSYLGPVLGRRAAPPWLTVLDDPVSPNAAFGYRVDDEGTPARAVPLIDRGVVREVLHSRTSAAAAGAEPNGHGRRMNYLYPAIPRQAHTRVLPGPHPPGEVLDQPGEAVLVTRFRVRYVNVAGGTFSFLAPRAVLLSGGTAVARLRDVRISGDGLSALAGTEAVGSEPAAWIGGGGCGKLDQGPLIVGFEQPVIRVHGLRTASTGDLR